MVNLSDDFVLAVLDGDDDSITELEDVESGKLIGDSESDDSRDEDTAALTLASVDAKDDDEVGSLVDDGQALLVKSKVGEEGLARLEADVVRDSLLNELVSVVDESADGKLRLRHSEDELSSGINVGDIILELGS